MSKILILANHYNTLRIFRRELIKELVKNNHEVVISIPKAETKHIKLLESYGAQVIITNFNRRGINPIKDLILFYKYFNLITQEKPDKVITYTIKPNIYGSMVCKIKGIKHYVNITGLGSSFQSNNLTRKIVSVLYRISLKSADKVFFENIGNRNVFLENNIIKPKQVVVLSGAGVNLEEFQFMEYPEIKEEVNFLFVGRIMKEKGVEELFNAIRRIKQEYSEVIFTFIGWYEDDYENIIRDMEEGGLISYKGFQANVKPFISKAHCVILPSYHEGMSNTLLESGAIGRPLITTNIYGCKEAVIDGETGYLINKKDEMDLYEKIKQFIELPYYEKRNMGAKSRKHIEKGFDKNEVVRKTLTEMSCT